MLRRARRIQRDRGEDRVKLGAGAACEACFAQRFGLRAGTKPVHNARRGFDAEGGEVLVERLQSVAPRQRSGGLVFVALNNRQREREAGLRTRIFWR